MGRQVVSCLFLCIFASISIQYSVLTYLYSLAMNCFNTKTNMAIVTWL